jgi:hypothetical protein
MTQNFVNAVLRNEPLVAPGQDGVRGLEIGNAMLMAGVTRTPVELPLDGDAVERLIQELGQKYGGRKTLGGRGAAAGQDMASSFGRQT